MTDPISAERIANLKARMDAMETQVAALLDRVAALEMRPQVEPSPAAPLFGVFPPLKFEPIDTQRWDPLYRSETRTTTRYPIPDDGC